jgi:hypothetical protein
MLCQTGLSLMLNVSKTKFMIIISKRSSATDRPLLTIDGEQIEEVQSMIYLGVQIDNKLDFKEHLNLIIKNQEELNLDGCLTHSGCTQSSRE